MKTQIQERPKHSNHPKSDLAIAKRLAERVRQKCGSLVTSIILEQPRGFHNPNVEEQLTIAVILDDLTKKLTHSMIKEYMEKTKKAMKLISPRIKVKNIRFTEMWDGIQQMNPTYTDLLRNGTSLHDRGFFTPMQDLLFTGKIKPTYESMGIYFGRTQTTLRNANFHMLQSAIDLYWATIDAAHALLMYHGYLPPSPGKIPELLEKELRPKKLIDSADVKVVKEMVQLYKGINRKEVRRVDGHSLDVYRKRVETFVKRIKKRLHLPKTT